MIDVRGVFKTVRSKDLTAQQKGISLNSNSNFTVITRAFSKVIFKLN